MRSGRTTAMRELINGIGVASVLLLMAGTGVAGDPAGELQALAGPRGNRWGDSREKVQKAEGRDPAVSLDTCLSFTGVEIDGRKYDVAYECFERGGGAFSQSGWRATRKAITTATMRLTPFGPVRAIDIELDWWEKELARKYGAPAVRLEASPGTDPAVIWPYWCPPLLTSQQSWTNGDCALPSRFTKYRRWVGKKTVVELYDQGVHSSLRMADSEWVTVAFSQREFFDAAEKARAHTVELELSKQSDQARRQKQVPAF